ncbi:hypothetical protein ARMGADRAFT_1020466, partial [Armillaria gallica]
AGDEHVMETTAPACIEHHSTDPDHLNELHSETCQVQTRQSNNSQSHQDKKQDQPQMEVRSQQIL